MKLTKKIALSAIAAATLGAMNVSAGEAATVYGKLNLSFQVTDDGLDGNEVKSNASRFGIKGKAKLSDSLKAIYKVEWEVDISDNAKASDDHIKARNQYVGLEGNFGQVIAGRHDTPTKKIQKKIDLFNDLEGDIKNLVGGEVRASNLVQYSTPKFAGGIKVKVAATTPAKGAAETSQDDFGTASSVSVEWSNKDLFVAFAQDNDVAGVDQTNTRFVAQYNLGNWQFGGLYNEHDNGVIDEEGYIVSVAYKTGNNTFKLQTGESDEGTIDEEMTSFGIDHKLGKKTKVYAFYTDQEDAAGTDKSWIGLGLEHKF
ncbi:porin [Pleionea sp. CnH1-48]|uniref:porin n=1 Tax=Pleionea sp. CnH1-48 TaxID=2954494 RepID=UPI002096D7B5|nr:porin [Pleionea sp. CnH1-48]MCO7226748.1 porin [Pleionea sp. CnH1-48]